MVSTLLAELRQRDIEVWAEGERLRCRIPAGVLTPALQDELQRSKSAILEFLLAAEARTTQERAIVPFQPCGQQIPVFAVGGHNGDVFCYRPLARELGQDQPFFGLQPPGLDGHRRPLTSVKYLAIYFASQIRSFRPAGPYVIGGYCAGGAIAFELARQLEEQGSAVSFVALFASPYPAWFGIRSQLRERLEYGLGRVTFHARSLASRSPTGRHEYLAEMLQHWVPRRERSQEPDPVQLRQTMVEKVTLTAVRRFRPGHFAGRLRLLQPAPEWLRAEYARERWRRVAPDTEESFVSEGADRYGLLREPYVGTTARLFRECAAKAASPSPGDAEGPHGVGR